MTIRTNRLLLAAWGIPFLILSSCIEMKPIGSKVNGGKIELIDRPGLLGSKGLRVAGYPIRFSKGKCFLTLEASELPLQGSEWPYMVELRFFRSASLGSEPLNAQVAQSITMKFRLEGSASNAVGESRLSTDWIRTASELGRDFYYYPKPQESMGVQPFVIMNGKSMRLFVELNSIGVSEDKLLASISIRTGGTK
jgi:hypothetical protein